MERLPILDSVDHERYRIEHDSQQKQGQQAESVAGRPSLAAGHGRPPVRLERPSQWLLVWHRLAFYPEPPDLVKV